MTGRPYYPGLDGEPMDLIDVPIDIQQIVADARRERSRAITNIICALLEWRRPNMGETEFFDGRFPHAHTNEG